ncbi:sensor domain-containing protein [Rubrobacter aplysinae]|uniref:sensor domain-containing protein n=1 Tax=Rubrobacter aplysinae TaxID=909625 RepID=UPI00069F5E40|nr:PAS domain S-box protein [Rubrobacter aplysinae]
MSRELESGVWDLVTVVDASGIVVAQSAGAERVLGIPADGMVGWSVLDFIHPEDMAAGERAFRESTSEPGASLPLELRWLRRDGSWRWLETVCTSAISGSGATEIVCSSRDVTGRLEARRALFESERRFRAIVESSLEVVKLVSTTGKLLYANPAFKEVYGYDPAESVAAGMNVLDYIHPEDLPRVVEDTRRTLVRLDSGEAVGEPPDGPADDPPDRPFGHTTEYRFLGADGSYRWIEGVGTYLLDEPGVEGVIVHARDITERREAERSLRESEQLRRVVASGAPVVLFALDSEGVFTLSEGQGLAALGAGQNEVVGHSVFELHRDEPRILENNRRVLAGEEVADTVEHHGSYFETRYSPLLGESGRVEGAVCIAIDVTERRLAEAQSRMKDRALEASSNGVLITDPSLEDNPIIYVNPAFQRLSGYEPEEILGRNCRIFQSEDREQPELAALAEAIAAGREYSCTIRNYRKDGTFFYNELYVAPVRDAAGNLTNFVGIQNDVTERRMLEEELSYRAFHDSLTELPNRSLFMDRLDNALARASRREEPVSVLFMDLDDFKKINDSSGHEAGDRLLRAVAGRLSECLRPGDTICRLGGDEFVLMLENTGETESAALSERIIGALQGPLDLGEDAGRASITVSLGVAVVPPGRAQKYLPENLLSEADAAMYRVKYRSKAGYEVSVLGEPDPTTPA